MDALGSKIFVSILLALLKMGSGLLPMGLVRLLKKGGMKWMEHFMAGLMCFGGGVLLATVFIHMLPEVRDAIELARIEMGKPEHQPGDYGIAELVFCGGFFFVYVSEALVQKIFHLSGSHGHSHGLPTSDAPVTTSNGHGHNHIDLEKSMTSSESTKKSKGEKTPINAKAKEKKLLSSIRSFVIVLALSIHSIFEGMAIGLQLNSTDVWMLFLAVVIHECAILFCVGNEMVNNGMAKLKIFLYILTLGVITPIGIIVGMILTLDTDETVDAPQSIAVGVLQGLAGGTLLYITFYEVLEREKLEKIGMTGIIGCFLLISGFAFMAGLTAWGSHFGQGDAGNSTSSSNSTTETNWLDLSFNI